MASFFDIRARQAAAIAASTSNSNPSSSSNTIAPDTTRHQPWVEKYRPKTLDDIAAQDHTVTVLRRTLQSANLPHMLFYGPPGTGKTSTILALAKQLYGPLLIKTRVLELNASDERGISIVREKVKDFARMQLSNPPSGAAGESYKALYPCPPYKIVILDEADSMTQDAQAALRRTMETYSKITRFCLVCNYVTRIIDPLASRCSKFRFKALDEGNAGQRVRDIAKLEGVRMEQGVVEALLKCSEGDLRKAITFLQSAARLVGAVATSIPTAHQQAVERKRKRGNVTVPDDDDDNGGDGTGDHRMPDAEPTATSATNPITVPIIEEIAGVIPNITLAPLLAALQPSFKNHDTSNGSGNIKNASSGTMYNRASIAVEDLIADGWSAGQIVTQLYEALVLMGDEALTGDWARSAMLGCFSEADKRLVDGSDEHLTVLDLCLRAGGLAGAG